MQTRNLVMFAVAMAGVAGGVFLPGPAGVFRPLVLPMMMAILFLSFIRLKLDHLTSIRWPDLAELGVLTLLKLAVLPAGLWALARVLWPDQALSVLLLSGVSTGVTAPFFAGIIRADVTRVLQLTVVTSVLVPFTLPALVKLLMGADLQISFWHMARLLLVVIFAPLGLTVVARRFAPRVLDLIDRRAFPLSLAMFFLINAGVFSTQADFLRREGWAVLAAVLGAGLLGVIYALTGLLYGLFRRGMTQALTGAAGLSFINNVLVVVFAAKFFGDQGPLLAAMYMIPFFGLLVPLGWLGKRGAA
ncbi:MAG: hypothetical protein KJ621_02270 [Proteobacteria bacterium]|nr:hypothetical protein [Pseudomonadota bacterium]MBU1741442.1 hypothetical protein [Pseudomonadota bacterium]